MANSPTPSPPTSSLSGETLSALSSGDIRFKESSHAIAVLKALAGAPRIVVTSHANPDPDAYASSVALAYGLRKLGKQTVCVNRSGLVPDLAYLPLVSEVKTHNIMNKPDLIVVTDCASLSGIGRDISEINPENAPIINLDHHHLSNTQFGAHNLVSNEVSCSSELAYVLLRDLRVPFDSDLATLLLAGIYNDTVSLQKLITSPETFQVVKELFSLGGNPERFTDSMYRNTPTEVLKFKGRLLSKMEPQGEGRYLPIVVDLSKLSDRGLSERDLVSLKILPLEVAGVVIGAFIRVDGDTCRVSLRSKGAADARAVAAHFGGHGHKSAAGFTFHGSIHRLLPELEAKVRESLP